MGKNRIKLNICGMDCVLSSEDGEAYARDMAKKVENFIGRLMEANPRISLSMAAVIAALNFCDAAQKASDSADNLRTQIKDYLEDSSHARMDADESRKEIERLKREIQTLRGRLSASAAHELAAHEPIQRQPPSGSPAAAPVSSGVSTARSVPAPMEQPKADKPPEGQQNFMDFFEKDLSED